MFSLRIIHPIYADDNVVTMYDLVRFHYNSCARRKRFTVDNNVKG